MGSKWFALSFTAHFAVREPSQPPAASDKPPMTKPATPSSSSQAKPATHPWIGLTAISIDGIRVGDVRAAKANLDGKVTALLIRSGKFLGFGTRIVEIPATAFIHNGDNVLLTLTAEEVNKLPEVHDPS